MMLWRRLRRERIAWADTVGDAFIAELGVDAYSKARGLQQDAAHLRAKKRRINPMQSLPMHQALRCHAKSKRSGLRCRAPAVRGREVCRMHGAAGGAPKGNRNALKHGDFTAEATALKREGLALARMARERRMAGIYGRPFAERRRPSRALQGLPLKACGRRFLALRLSPALSSFAPVR
jgi:hypothetical protein